MTAAPTTSAAVSTTTTVPPTTTTVLTVADDPVALAAQVTDAERTLRDPATIPEDAEQIGVFQQLAYRRLSSHPEWDAPFMAAVGTDVAPAAANNLAAFRAFQRPPHGPAPENLPAWRIVPPRPAAELLGYYHEAEATTGVPWYYVAAINLIETRMGRIDGLSTAGAQGPMQFLPTTWAECCTGDIEDPHDAIVGAAVYLKRSGAPENMDRRSFATTTTRATSTPSRRTPRTWPPTSARTSAITRGRSSTRPLPAASICPSATKSRRRCPPPTPRAPPPNPADAGRAVLARITGQERPVIRIGTEADRYSGEWQTASTLLPSGSRTNAP